MTCVSNRFSVEILLVWKTSPSVYPGQPRTDDFTSTIQVPVLDPRLPGRCVRNCVRLEPGDWRHTGRYLPNSTSVRACVCVCAARVHVCVCVCVHRPAAQSAICHLVRVHARGEAGAGTCVITGTPLIEDTMPAPDDTSMWLVANRTFFFRRASGIFPLVSRLFNLVQPNVITRIKQETVA